MSWIVDAHYEWHAVHGANACCPLDCNAGVDQSEDYEGFAPAPPTPIVWSDPWVESYNEEFPF